jgi:hypothetical protein
MINNRLLNNRLLNNRLLNNRSINESGDINISNNSSSTTIHRYPEKFAL